MPKTPSKSKAAATPFRLSRFTNNGGAPLSKTLSLIDGKIVTTGAAEMREGIVEHVEAADLDALAKVIDECGPSQALALGIVKAEHRPAPGASAPIAVDSFRGAGEISRTKQFFEFPAGPGLIFLDYDQKGMTPRVAKRLEDIGGVEAALISVFPPLETAAMIVRASTSAGIFNAETGERFAGSGGLHIFIAIENANGSDFPRALKAAHERLIINGYGWCLVSASGALLERSPVDSSVASPERLIFEAPPIVTPPLAQNADERACRIIDGEMIDSRQVFRDLDDGERAQLRAAIAAMRAERAAEASRVRAAYNERMTKKIMSERGVDREAARRCVDERRDNELLPEHIIEFDRSELGAVSVAAIYRSPARYVGASASDPWEGRDYGRGKAKLFRDDFSGRLRMNSFAHGGASYHLIPPEDIVPQLSRERNDRLRAVFEKVPVDWDLVARLAAEREAKFTTTAIVTRDGLPDIPGGAYPADELLPAISARFALVDREGEVNVVHRDAAGADHVLAKGSFESYLANVVVRTENDNGDEKFFPAAKWWKAHPKRPPVRRAIFDPHRKARIDEYNFWRGFGVAPIQGRDKIKSFLAHLWIVVARRDRRKFKYIVRWLSWAVQNPEKRAETVIVLKSEAEGSGKSTVSDAMRVILGKHAAVVSDPSEVVGNHVDDLEFVSFLQMEEALFAGDPKTADKIKHAITGATLRINPKGRKAYQATNRIHAILTTNHSWAVPAGREARRWFIVEVSEEKVGDRAWFDRIYDDLQAGGYGQLLNYLQLKKLGNWHPRNMPRTIELAAQQIRSASSVHHWLLACADDGAIEAYERGVRKEHLQLELGADHATTKLYDAYAGAQRMQGGRVDQKIHFARMLAKILGENAHVRHAGARNCRGFHIPQADELTQRVKQSLGIVERVTDGARECNRRADVDDDDGGPF